MVREKNEIYSEELVSGPYLFLWKVATAGYRWEAAEAPFKSEETRGPWLIDPTPVGASGEWIQYASLKKPGLHRRFAKLAPTEEDILRFANEFGLLEGGEWPLKIPDSSLAFNGERFGLWIDELTQMAGLIMLWDRCKKSAVEALLPLVQWWADRTVKVNVWWHWNGREWALHPLDLQADDPYHAFLGSGGPGRAMAPTLSAPYLNPHLSRHWQRRDPRGPLRYLVCQQVNEKLKGHVSPVVLPLRDGEVRLVPDSLRASLWLLFALEISGRERQPIECLYCGKYFTPGHGRQQYCEVRCSKKRAYHKANPRPQTTLAI